MINLVPMLALNNGANALIVIAIIGAIAGQVAASNQGETDMKGRVKYAFIGAAFALMGFAALLIIAKMFTGGGGYGDDIPYSK